MLKKKILIVNLKKYFICNSDVDNNEIVGKRMDCKICICRDKEICMRKLKGLHNN